MNRFTALLGILCVAAMVAIMPTVAMADGPHDFKNDSHTNIHIDSNTGNAVIVSGHHNTVTIHIDRTRHDNHAMRSRPSEKPITNADYFRSPPLSRRLDPKCEPTTTAHNERVAAWLASMRR